jgi:hypothetical protein
MQDPHSLTKHAVVALYESVYLAPQQRNLLVKIAVRCPGLVRTNISSAERNRPAEPHHEPFAMIPERPNDAAGGDMREDELLFELAKLGGSPLFFCKCSLQRILSPMFWKCSFQRVYKRVCGSADSKGFSDWRRDWWIFHADRGCAVFRLQPAPSKFPTARHDFSILPPTPRFRTSEGT